MPGSSSESAAVKTALEDARNCDSGSLPASTSAILRAALEEIWSHIYAAPDIYVPSPAEFAVFNFFRAEYTGQKEDLAKKVIKRFWNNYQASPSTDGGNK
jgi:hypothetical protein